MPRITPSPLAKNVTELGPNHRMTPEQVLAYASRRQWEKIIITGYYLSDGEFGTLSSQMTRETANWLVDHLKLHILDRL